MKRRVYTEDSIRESLRQFEGKFGLLSHDFYESYKVDGKAIDHVPGFERRHWESLYVELLEDEQPVRLSSDTGELLPAN